MGLPSNLVLDVAYASVEILGDHVLTTVMSGRDVCCFYLVSWKSGTVTLVSRNLTQRLRHVSGVTSLLTIFSPQLREIELSNRWTPLWVPRLVDIDGSLIMLANCTKNSLEICKLELASSSQEPPRMYTVCSLELPALEPYAFVVVSTVDKEWVPTATRGGARCQLTRKRVVPFRSSKVGTIGLLVEHEMRTASVRVLPSCWMTVSVPALLSVIRSDPQAGHMRTIPWGDWGPAATRVLLNTYGARLPKPAGPFWIAGSSPLVIRDYDLLRTRYSRISGQDPSTSRFGPPVFKSTEVFGEHWKTGKLETCLPYRDLVAKDLDFIGILADREWIIGISVRVRCPGIHVSESLTEQVQGPEGLYYTIYHIG